MDVPVGRQASRQVLRRTERQGVLAILKFRPDWSLPAVGVVQRAHVEPAPALTHFLEALRSEAQALQGAPAGQD